MRLASQSLDYNLCEQSTEQQRGGQSIFQEAWAYVEGRMNEECRAESLSNFGNTETKEDSCQMFIYMST